MGSHGSFKAHAWRLWSRFCFRFFFCFVFLDFLWLCFLAVGGLLILYGSMYFFLSLYPMIWSLGPSVFFVTDLILVSFFLDLLFSGAVLLYDNKLMTICLTCDC